MRRFYRNPATEAELARTPTFVGRRPSRRLITQVPVIEDISDLPYLATIARVAQWSFDSIPVSARHTFKGGREN